MKISELVDKIHLDGHFDYNEGCQKLSIKILLGILCNEYKVKALRDSNTKNKAHVYFW